MQSKEAILAQLRFMFSSTIVMTNNKDALKMSLKEVEEYMMEKYNDYYEWLMEE